MLAQLLRKHGFGARAVPNEATSRGGIGGLDPTDVAMVCITHLDIGANPSRLRYAVQRLRATAPDRLALLVVTRRAAVRVGEEFRPRKRSMTWRARRPGRALG